MSVFEKLHEAAQSNQGVHLTFSEVELLMDVLGDNFGLAEQEYEKWRGIFEEYQHNVQIEQGQSETE